MNNTKLKLLYGTKEYLLFIFLLLLISLLSLYRHYSHYQSFKYNEISSVQATILNLYIKKEYDVIKFRTKNFDAFTSVSKGLELKQLDQVKLYLYTKNVSFLDYLKGFYSSNIKVYKLDKGSEKRSVVSQEITAQHTIKHTQELFNALFLALPISKELREVCAYYGISHLIAISGFHLGLIALVIYGILYFPYSWMHQSFFPYRNKKLDIAIITTMVLLVYLLFTDIVPSLLRAFVMFVLGVYLLRNNIKLFSFNTLLLTFLVIIALFPQYLFSLSLWFSLAGVFYIFLFLQYFKNMPKVGQLLLFNFWIFAAMNPITHYFFAATSYLQLFSPILTLLFTLFYPMLALLHILGLGGVFDGQLQWLFNQEAYASEVLTPLWFMVVYGVCSLCAIKSKRFFMVLNVLMVLFTLCLAYFNIRYYLG